MDSCHLLSPFLLLILSVRSATDFSMYLHSILKNHTAHACEGEMLTIQCPSRTSVSVLSAFYGRRVPSQHLCSSADSNITAGEDTECSSPVATEKVLSECQDRQSCHIPVLSPVFGQDPCPLTTKYLFICYKCRPEHHQTRLVCENERLMLMCKNGTVLAIYSATFGHLMHGSPSCPQGPGSRTDMECLSASALRKVSRRCHCRTNCSVLADTQTFGDPCFPGTRKHLRVSFTCVPRYLLEDVGRGSTDPFMISDYTHGGWYSGPTFRPKNLLFSSSLEIFDRILGLPEHVALYFVSGICAGLVFLLCLFGLRSTLLRDVNDLVSELKVSHRRNSGLMEDLFDQEVSDTSSIHCLTHSDPPSKVYSPPVPTEEMVCWKGDNRRDMPNGDVWPHPDSSPYSIHKIRTYNM